MTNPFLSASQLNGPLLPEICQRLHAQALFLTAQGRGTDGIPSSVPVARRRTLLQQTGPENCLTHPREIEHLFQGVTFSLYQCIASLYCSRIARSIPMVTRIVNALARGANTPPLHPEAIWAICLHLDGQRAHLLQLTTQPSQARWWLGTIPPATPLVHDDDQTHSILVAVIDISAPAVLAFRIGMAQSLAELTALALYDALVAGRYPHPSGASGLVWVLPSSLLTTTPPPQACTLACTSLGLNIDACVPSAVPLLADVSLAWQRLHTSEPLRRQGHIVFDTLLKHIYGSSPLRTCEHNDHRFRHMRGYQRDPAQLVPPLRALLPASPASISTDGHIFFDGLHYTDDLLALFPGACVSICQSEHTEAVIWVFLDGEILGEARARELVRRDGSYRAHR